jgi:transposase
VIDLAQEDPSAIFLAEDEAGMYLPATTMSIGAVRGPTPVVRVDPKRTKVGCSGTINRHTGEELVTRSTERNSLMTTQPLQEILDRHPHRRIVLLWDRAKWHRGPTLRKLVTENPRLPLLAFPTAAPDLNPQEQVWKQTRRAVSHNHIFPKLPELADCFEPHLRSTIFSSSFLERYGYNLVCPFLN